MKRYRIFLYGCQVYAMILMFKMLDVEEGIAIPHKASCTNLYPHIMYEITLY